MRNVKVHITREKQRETKQHFITFGFEFQVSSNKFKTNACLMSHTVQKKKKNDSSNNNHDIAIFMVLQ